jgi:hypothetical protein
MKSQYELDHERDYRKHEPRRFGPDPKERWQIVSILLGEAIETADGCMICTRAKDPKGYARVGVDGGHRTQIAHRVVFHFFKGLNPPDKPFVLHTCDNPSCINPDHLFAGTAAENTAQMLDRHRGANHAWSNYSWSIDNEK